MYSFFEIFAKKMHITVIALDIEYKGKTQLDPAQWKK